MHRFVNQVEASTTRVKYLTEFFIDFYTPAFLNVFSPVIIR